MERDELLENVAEVIRDERPDPTDPRLLALSRGDANDATIRELEREAERDPEAARRLEAYRPLSDDMMRRLDRVAEPTPVLRFSPRRIGVVASLAAAAAAAFFFFFAIQPDPLPEYVWEVTAGDAATRGDPPSAPSVRSMRADSRFTLSVAPAQVAVADVEARAFVLVEGRATRSASVSVAETGAARVDGPIAELTGIEAGRATIVLVIARSGQLPSLETLQRTRGERTSGRGWQAQWVDVVVQRREESR